MQRDIPLFRQHDLVAALMAISGICGAACMPTPVMAEGDESLPAPLIELPATTADKLAAFGCALPVLVAHAKQGWAAVVLPSLVQSLLLPDVQGPGCVPEGAISCCDEATGAWVLYTEVGWLRMGQRCEEPPHDEGLDVVPVPQALTQELYELGVDDSFMDCADADGRGLVLWNTPSESGELSLPPRMMQGSAAPLTSSISHVVTAETRAPIILAHRHSSSSCDDNEPPSCKEKRNRVCHEDEEHWWAKMAISGNGETWCRREPCNCPD
jgi:hypothetical protein